MKHCKLWNVSRGEKRRKKKVKIKTQNEKIVETYKYIWKNIYEINIYIYMKKQLLELGRNNAM